MRFFFLILILLVVKSILFWFVFMVDLVFKWCLIDLKGIGIFILLFFSGILLLCLMVVEWGLEVGIWGIWWGMIWDIGRCRIRLWWWGRWWRGFMWIDWGLGFGDGWVWNLFFLGMLFLEEKKKSWLGWLELWRIYDL